MFIVSPNNAIDMTRFSRCTLPAVFWPYWSAIHLLDISQPLWETAEGSGAVLLLDTYIEWSVLTSETLIAKEKSICLTGT